MVDWAGIGQSIQLTVGIFAETFPELAKKEGGADAWASRVISDYISHYYPSQTMTTFGPSPFGNGWLADAARQCALGNRAACGN